LWRPNRQACLFPSEAGDGIECPASRRPARRFHDAHDGRLKIIDSMIFMTPGPRQRRRLELR
jgi:hypothetical protein